MGFHVLARKHLVDLLANQIHDAQVGGEHYDLLIQLLDQPVLEIGKDAIHFAATDGVSSEIELLMDQFPGLCGQALAARDGP